MNTPYSTKDLEDELVKTTNFVQKVYRQFNLVPNNNETVNQRVIQGLAHNKLIYGKRFCPCFIVVPNGENRICPCKPALEYEIPTYGACHCGLFCTQNYAKTNTDIKTQNISNQSLQPQEAKEILEQRQLASANLEELLKAREDGLVNFVLIDVREAIEHEMQHIVGTDVLFPTSGFYDKHKNLEIYKTTPIILYCATGSRSFQVQQILQSYDFEHVCNLAGGIFEYRGECT
ncbi:MAG TPA: sulfurtransferase [Epsilonproteobacteria bacterium]|nr:sulfurtransferase [Campylobacterota bacterium]